MKKKILFAAAALGIMAMITGQTLAYFTESDTKTNTFTVGDLDIEEKETEWDDDDDGKDIRPGTILYKNPTVRNITSNQNGDEPAYARMIVEIQDESGNPVEDPAVTALIWKTIRYDPTYNGSGTKKGSATGLKEGAISTFTEAQLEENYRMISPLFTLDTARSSLHYRKVFNYVGTDSTGVLKSGQEAILFSNVVIPVDWNQTQLTAMGSYRLKIEAQAIQSTGFASQADAFTALDAEISGGTLQARS